MIRRLGRGSIPAGLAIVLGVAGEVLLVSALPIFVTSDGPSHVDAAAALARLILGPESPADRYVMASWLPLTNALHLPMAGLISVAGPVVGEKLTLIGFAILLPAALHYAVTGVRSDAGWLAVLALPLTFNVLLQLGFLSFCYAVLGFLLVAGYHARHGASLRPGKVILLGAVLSLTYVLHVVVFAVALLLLVTMEAGAWLIERPRRPGRLVRRSALMLMLAAPPLIAILAWLATRPAGDLSGSVPLFALQLASLAETMTLVRQLVALDQREAVFAILAAALLLALLLLAARMRLRPGLKLQANDGYLIVGAVLLFAITLLEDSATLWFGGPGGFVTSRLSFLGAFIVILWLAAHPFSARARGATVGISLVALVGLLGVRLPWYVSLAGHAEAFAALAPCVAEGATMTQVNLARLELPSTRTAQIWNETGRLTSVTRGLDMGNSTLGSHVHLLQYRDELDPYRYLRDRGGLPATVDPIIDPQRYTATTGGRLDYVLVFGRREAAAEVLASAPWRELAAQLSSDYRRVAVADDGLLEVYERLDTPAAERGEARRTESAACQAATAADRP